MPTIGCAPTQTLPEAPQVIERVKEVVIEPPQGLRACKDEPLPPGDPNDVEAGANHKLDLALAGRDCRSKVRQMDEFIRRAKDEQ